MIAMQKRTLRAGFLGLLAALALAVAPSAFAHGRWGVNIGIGLPGVSIGYAGCHHCGWGGGYRGYVGFSGAYYAPAYYGPAYYGPAYYGPAYYGPAYYAPPAVGVVYYDRPVRRVYRERYYDRDRDYGQRGSYYDRRDGR